MTGPVDTAVPLRPTQFTYAVIPESVPFGSGNVALLIAVANNTDDFVECPQITITVPDALTTNPSSIAASSLDHSWDFTKGNDPNTFVAVPYAPATGLRAGASLGLLLSDVAVADDIGLCEMIVQETTSAGLGVGALAVATTSPGLAISEFRANTLDMPPGGNVTLTWATTAATGVTLSYSGGSYPQHDSGTAGPITLAQTTAFTLTATGAGAIVQSQLTVTVEPVQISGLAATPSSVAQGGQTTLSWTATNAETLTIAPGPISLPGSATSQLLTLPQQPTSGVVYTVTALGADGTSAAATQFVAIEPVTITSFGFAPQQIPMGGSATMSWATNSAIDCWMDPDPGFPVDTSGEGTIAPSETTTYTLHAEGYGTVTQTATLTVAPLITLFGISLDPANPGNANLTWSSTGATSVVSDAGEVGASGTQQVYAGHDYAFAYTFSDSAGNATSLQVTLGALDDGAGTVLTSLTIQNSGGINVGGQTVDISWQGQAGDEGFSIYTVYPGTDIPLAAPLTGNMGSTTRLIQQSCWSLNVELPDFNTIISLEVNPANASI